jgi:signal transduction histidine kinase
VRLADLDLRSTVEEVIALAAPEARAGGVEVQLEPGDPVRASFDSERIKQVLLNLVRNAVEATGRGGRVRLAVSTTDEAPCFQVIDDGPGIPDDAPIFEPFFTTKSAGTGLGLAIVHRIVSDHSGRISYTSRPGHTVFTVELPRATS